VIEDGKMITIDCCRACAKENKIVVKDLSTFSPELFAKHGKVRVLHPSNETKCDFCGNTQKEFKKTGRFGCVHCYEVFGKELAEALKTIYRISDPKHTGKVPERLRSSLELKARHLLLQKLLQEAVNSENYEEAARLRDQLKLLREDSEELSSTERRES